jgi:hypothetical protein
VRDIMKTAHGRWVVDSEAKVLSYDNGRVLRIFTIPPGGALSLSEALEWIAGAEGGAWLSVNELGDLAQALGEMFGLGQLFSLSEL